MTIAVPFTPLLRLAVPSSTATCQDQKPIGAAAEVSRQCSKPGSTTRYMPRSGSLSTRLACEHHRRKSAANNSNKPRVEQANREARTHHGPLNPQRKERQIG